MDFRIKKKGRACLVLGLSGVLAFGCVQWPGIEQIPSVVQAVDTRAAVGVASNNIHHHDYYESSGNWASNVNSYLYKNQDGSYTRVEYTDSAVIIEEYNGTDFTLRSSKRLSPELPLFGGFYAGSDYNYIVFGQENTAQDNSKEVFRIVQYRKDWTRVASDSLLGANTTVPFQAGSVSFSEYQNMVYVRTSHEMYRSSDGLNHQANVTFSYNKQTGRITDSCTDIMNLASTGFVSHSFNQFLKMDGNQIFAIDHGDTNPRSIVLSRYNTPAGADKFVGACSYMDVFTFEGKVGDNYTGAAVGGFEVSDRNYLVAFQSVDQIKDYSGTIRNVYLGVVSRNGFPAASKQNQRITDFATGGQYSASNPVLVKLSDNSFVLLWERYSTSFSGSVVNKSSGTLQYVRLDGAGNQLGGIQTVTGSLSDCQPVVSGDELVWYVTNNSVPKFHILNLTSNRLTIKDSGAVPSTSPSIRPSTSPTVSPGVYPYPTLRPTIRPTETPRPTRTPRPTATPYSPYDEVWPDDSDLETNDEVGPDNPSWEDYEQENQDREDENNGSNAEEKVPQLGQYYFDEKAQYVVTKSDAVNGTVEYRLPIGNVSSVNIPEYIWIGSYEFAVTAIADNAFKDSSVKSVTISSNVTKIGAKAFQNAFELKKVAMNNEVKSIGKQAFQNCEALTSLTLPDTVNSIGKKAFAGCRSLKKLTIKSKKLTASKIGGKAFLGIPQKAVVKVPKAKLSAYKKLLRKKGLHSKVKLKA